MKDDTEFGQNFRSAVNGFLTKINRMTKTRLSWVFRQATNQSGMLQFENSLSDLPLDRVKAAEENEAEDVAKEDDA